MVMSPVVGHGKSWDKLDYVFEIPALNSSIYRRHIFAKVAGITRGLPGPLGTSIQIYD